MKAIEYSVIRSVVMDVAMAISKNPIQQRTDVIDSQW